MPCCSIASSLLLPLLRRTTPPLLGEPISIITREDAHDVIDSKQTAPAASSQKRFCLHTMMTPTERLLLAYLTTVCAPTAATWKNGGRLAGEENHRLLYVTRLLTPRDYLLYKSTGKRVYVEEANGAHARTKTAIPRCVDRLC